MKDKFYKMTYSNSGNLGDHIQTIATEQFIKAEGGVERDGLSYYNGEPILLLMQGWFGNVKRHKHMFPPSNHIKPIFIGFHISDTKEDREFYSSNNAINYFKKHEPIGCRDISTKLFLAKFGVETYFSRCLTTTFPTREKNPNKEKIFIVDCISDMLIPPKILNRAEKLTHHALETETQLEKEKKANLLLKRYKNEATLVITSRLHCALPCIAMGIPVIFIEDKHDIRFSAIDDLIDIKHIDKKIFNSDKSKFFQYIYAFYFRKKVNWNPKIVNIDNVKRKIIDNVHNRIENIFNL